jgi:hypothetical protein
MLRSFVTSAIALAVMGAFAAPASAQTCTPNAGPFCIEKPAIITDASNSGIAGSTKTVDPNGSTKELGPINSSTTKIGVINTAPTPMLGLTNPNSSVDLNTVYTQTAVDPATGHIWYYFGWVRDSNNGSGFISIELQKSGVPSACTGTSGYASPGCNPWSGRQTGDVIILWDQQGSSTDRFIRRYNAATHSFGAPEQLADSVSRAEYSADFFRGEVAIDFTEVVFPKSGECQSFANTIPGTVTGNSDSADYKDTVLAVFPPVSNCGAVTVKKVTDPAGEAGSFPYTLSRTGGSAIFAGTTVDSDCTNNGSTFQCDATLISDGDQDTIENLLAGSDYRVVEGSVGSAFQEVSLDCVLDGVTYHLYGTGTAPIVSAFPVAATKTTACTITNKKTIGVLRVVKVVNNGFGLTAQPGDFSFALDGGQAEPFANGGVSCVSGATCKEYTLPIGGSHNVVESDPGSNWLVGYSNCTNVAISATDPQTCTVTNTAIQERVNVQTKQRVLLFDRATVTQLRRVTSNEPAMTVRFSVYADAASCGAQTGALGTETVSIPANVSDTTVTVGTTSNTIEVKLDTHGDVSTVRYWRALFHQSGDNPPNADYLTDCNEITTVRLQQ